MLYRERTKTKEEEMYDERRGLLAEEGEEGVDKTLNLQTG